jgi:uncharacterized protein (TIGR03067 family)
MRCAFTLTLATLFALVTAHAAPIPKDTRPPAQIELDRLEGTWQVTSYLVAGRETISDRNSAMFVTFKKGAFAWGDGSSSGKIAKIDPTKTPKEVDYTLGSDANPGQPVKAIYKLEGDVFIDCFHLSGGDRPKEFSSTLENGYTLMTYKRVKKED